MGGRGIAWEIAPLQGSKAVLARKNLLSTGEECLALKNRLESPQEEAELNRDDSCFVLENRMHFARRSGAADRTRRAGQRGEQAKRGEHDSGAGMTAGGDAWIRRLYSSNETPDGL
jgi:hypothetical protein